MDKRAIQWVSGSDTGTSSKTIWTAMMDGVAAPHRLNGQYDIPYDPADFGRCHRLLQLIPEWRENLGKVSEVFPGWKPMVDAWPELEELWDEEFETRKAPKLYARIQELVDECRLADGWTRTSEWGWRRDQ